MPTGYVGALLAVVAALTLARLVLAPHRAGTLAHSLSGLRGWHVADRVRLSDQTLDHVVVAPAALLAVTESTHAPDRVDLHNAERAAHRLRQFAEAEGVAEIVVVPVVRVSGPQAPPSGHRIVEGVHVIDETLPASWLGLFREDRLETQPRIALARALDSRAAAPRRIRVRRHADLAPIAAPEAA